MAWRQLLCQCFFDLQERAREKAIYTAMAELKSRVNSHFCSDLLDGKSPDAVTYTGSEVGTWLSNDFLLLLLGKFIQSIKDKE